MWKEILPDNCPPKDASFSRIEVYRILGEVVPNENDFKPYAKMFEDNPRYKKLCKAYAISFYDTIEHAKDSYYKALGRGRSLGSHIAKYTIEEEHGCNEYEESSGHYSVWFKSNWNFETFYPSVVNAI